MCYQSPSHSEDFGDFISTTCLSFCSSVRSRFTGPDYARIRKPWLLFPYLWDAFSVLFDACQISHCQADSRRTHFGELGECLCNARSHVEDRYLYWEVFSIETVVFIGHMVCVWHILKYTLQRLWDKYQHFLPFMKCYVYVCVCARCVHIDPPVLGL